MFDDDEAIELIEKSSLGERRKKHLAEFEKLRADLVLHNEENKRRFEKAKYLYHRTFLPKSLEGILTDNKIKPSHEIYKIHRTWASLTTNVQLTTGGMFLIVFDKSKLMHNEFVPMNYCYPSDRTGDRLENHACFTDEWEIVAMNGLTFERDAIVEIVVDLYTYGPKSHWKPQRKGALTKDINRIKKYNPKIVNSLHELLYYENKF